MLFAASIGTSVICKGELAIFLSSTGALRKADAPVSREAYKVKRIVQNLLPFDVGSDQINKIRCCTLPKLQLIMQCYKSMILFLCSQHSSGSQFCFVVVIHGFEVRVSEQDLECCELTDVVAFTRFTAPSITITAKVNLAK